MTSLTQLIDIFLHLDVHLDDWSIRLGATALYLVLFLIIFCETGLVVTPILPGDSLLFAVGTFAASGALDLGLAILLLSVAAVLGDSVNYAIGYRLGPQIFRKRGVRFLNPEYLERTHRFYERHGAKTIVIARFIPIIRTFAPFVAGIGRMSYGQFVVYNIGGGLLWTVLFVFGGYYFGNLQVVKRHFTLVILAIIIISVLPAGLEFLRNYRRKARSAHSPPPEK